MVARDEEGGATLTYAELAAEVARVRAGLVALGVTRGDRVAAFLPNIPAALIGLLATASLGAIWSSVLARLRAAQRDRPVRADHTEGPAGHRPLPVRRQGVRPEARRSRP